MIDQGNIPFKANILIVDQSRDILNLTNKLLNKNPDLEVVSLLKTIKDAKEFVLKFSNIQVALIDSACVINEGMDEFTSLAKSSNHFKIIMLSDAQDKKNVTETIRSIAYGASDFVEKPINKNELKDIEIYEQNLLSKIRNITELLFKTVNPADFKLSLIKAPKKEPLFDITKIRPDAKTLTPIKADEINIQITEKPKPKELETKKPEIKNIDFNTPIILRTTKIDIPRAIAIASSTGGPQALCKVLADLKEEKFTQPIFITQHIPKNFSSSLAMQLSSVSGRKCYEAEDGMIVKRGSMYLAPGDFHMKIIKQENNDLMIKLEQSEPINFCRPSADPMFKSLSDIYKNNLLAIVLTGMGIDGLNGSKYIVNNGGVVIAQDKLTSVVWGMPGAVAVEGLCHAVLPIEQIPAYIEMIGAP